MRTLMRLAAPPVFKKKIRTYVANGDTRKDLPKMTKFKIESGKFEYKGETATQVTHTLVRLRQKDLVPVVDWFMENLYHPALGNFLFKFEVVDIKNNSY